MSSASVLKVGHVLANYVLLQKDKKTYVDWLNNQEDKTLDSIALFYRIAPSNRKNTINRIVRHRNQLKDTKKMISNAKSFSNNICEFVSDQSDDTIRRVYIALFSIEPSPSLTKKELCEQIVSQSSKQFINSIANLCTNVSDKPEEDIKAVRSEWVRQQFGSEEESLQSGKRKMCLDMGINSDTINVLTEASLDIILLSADDTLVDSVTGDFLTKGAMKSASGIRANEKTWDRMDRVDPSTKSRASLQLIEEVQKQVAKYLLVTFGVTKEDMKVLHSENVPILKQEEYEVVGVTRGGYYLMIDAVGDIKWKRYSHVETNIYKEDSLELQQFLFDQSEDHLIDALVQKTIEKVGAYVTTASISNWTITQKEIDDKNIIAVYKSNRSDYFISLVEHFEISDATLQILALSDKGHHKMIATAILVRKLMNGEINPLPKKLSYDLFSSIRTFQHCEPEEEGEIFNDKSCKQFKNFYSFYQKKSNHESDIVQDQYFSEKFRDATLSWKQFRMLDTVEKALMSGQYNQAEHVARLLFQSLRNSKQLIYPEYSYFPPSTLFDGIQKFLTSTNIYCYWSVCRLVLFNYFTVYDKRLPQHAVPWYIMVKYWKYIKDVGSLSGNIPRLSSAIRKDKELQEQLDIPTPYLTTTPEEMKKFSILVSSNECDDLTPPLLSNLSNVDKVTIVTKSMNTETIVIGEKDGKIIMFNDDEEMYNEYLSDMLYNRILKKKSPKFTWKQLIPNLNMIAIGETIISNGFYPDNFLEEVLLSQIELSNLFSRPFEVNGDLQYELYALILTELPYFMINTSNPFKNYYNVTKGVLKLMETSTISNIQFLVNINHQQLFELYLQIRNPIFSGLTGEFAQQLLRSSAHKLFLSDMVYTLQSYRPSQSNIIIWGNDTVPYDQQRVKEAIQRMDNNYFRTRLNRRERVEVFVELRRTSNDVFSHEMILFGKSRSEFVADLFVSTYLADIPGAFEEWIRTRRTRRLSPKALNDFKTNINNGIYNSNEISAIENIFPSIHS